MELALVVYLISLFDQVGAGLVVCFMIPIVVGCIICGVNTAESRGEHKEVWFSRLKKVIKIGCIVTPILVIFVWLVPDKETSYTMLAAYGVQTVAESEEVKQVMGKSVKVFERYMDTYLKESQPKAPE